MAGQSDAMTDPGRLPEDVASVMRTAVGLGLVDHAGLVACRMADGGVLVTPGPRLAGRFRHLRVEDLEQVPVAGVDIRQDREHRLPRDLALATVLLGEQTGSTVIVGCGADTLRLAAVGRQALPLAHTNAELVHAGIAVLRPERTALDPDRARGILGPVVGGSTGETTGAPATIVLAGSSVVVRGPTPFEALRRLDGLELLARLTVALGADEPEHQLSRTDADAIGRSRPHEAVPSRDPVRYFRTIDPGAGRRSLADDLPATDVPNDVDEARTQLAIASRVLAAEGLVTYYEHLSSRAPGYQDRFLMTPAHDYARMLPSDVGILANDEDCSQIECRFPPAPFRWFHRDLFAARPDVDAIVHTHPLHARVRFLRADAPPRRVWHRDAVHAPDAVAVLSRPSLLFSEEDRRAMVALLAEAQVGHGLHHGTDYLADTVARATIVAIHDEELERATAVVAPLGEPTPLPSAYIEELRQHGTSSAEELAFRASSLAPLA